MPSEPSVRGTRSSHAGNVPKLPQSLECSFCTAKFTRQSHLKRHELTHSDKRRYECDKCPSTFTRKDLLTRHLRICGNSTRGSRKSCRACLDSKVKCDLQQPCTECKNHELECVMELPVHRRKARSACFIQDDENQTPDEPGPSNCAELPPIGAPTTVEPQHALQLENLPKNSNDFTSNIFIPHFNQSFSIPAPACKETTHSCTDADEYMSLFYEAFLPHVPIIHNSWEADEQPPIITKIMQACGALAVKSEVASDFLTEVWNSASEYLSDELSKDVTKPRDITTLIMVNNFLQATQIMHLHDSNDLRASTLVLVEIIRRQSYIQYLSTSMTKPPEFKSEPAILAAWRGWVECEMAKRTMWVFYIIDTLRFVFFGRTPALTVTEMVLPLPCDHSLWTSPNPVAWFLIYANVWSDDGADHMGVFMYDALKRLETEKLRHIDLSSPYSMFIVVITLLRLLNHLYITETTCLSERLPMFATAQPVNSSHIAADVARLGTMLDNWATSWFADPSTQAATEDELRYLWHPLPSYWITKLSLDAYNQASGPFVYGDRTKGNMARAMQKWRSCAFTSLRVHGDPGLGALRVVNYSEEDVQDCLDFDWRA